MNKIEKKQIYKKALDKWGTQAQITMVFEEMAELQKELCKNLRGNDMVEDIAEEIADVEIMLEQMKIIFEIEEDVKKFKEFKIERLAETLQK